MCAGRTDGVIGRGDGRDGEKTRGEGTEDADDIADNVQRMAERDGAGRRSFDEEGAAAEGGTSAGRLRESDGSERFMDGGSETSPRDAPPLPCGRLAEGTPWTTPDIGTTGGFLDLRRS